MENKFLEIEITTTRHWWTTGDRYMVFANHEDWPKDENNERGYTFDDKTTHYRLLDKEKYILKSDCVVLGINIICSLDEQQCRDSCEHKNNRSQCAFTNTQNDPVNHPSHYTSGKIEVIEAIEDWNLNFHRGQVIKYVARAGKKDSAKEFEDLKKAAWYLNREIEKLENGK